MSDDYEAQCPRSPTGLCRYTLIPPYYCVYCDETLNPIIIGQDNVDEEKKKI